MVLMIKLVSFSLQLSMNMLYMYSLVVAEELLTLPDPIPGKEKKLSWIFIFTLLCGVSEGFKKALKV